MALRRKVEAQFLAWKANPDRLPLVVNGVRQCGKTHSVLAFARAHYEHVVYLNFFEIRILPAHSSKRFPII